MKRKLLLASGCFLLLSGWFSAFFLNSIPHEGNLYILGSTLLLGIGLGLLHKTVGAKLTALILAFMALLALLLINQFFPDRSISISKFQQRMEAGRQAIETVSSDSNPKDPSPFFKSDMPLFAR